MPWTRLDDGFISHPKILRLSDVAFRLHVSGLNWSVANLTDGHIPDVVLAIALPLHKQRIRNQAASELEQAGLWSVNGDGWQVHDFADYQETKTVVSERRRKWAEKKRGQAHSPPDSPRDSTVETMSESPRESHAAPLRGRGRPTPPHPKEPSQNALAERSTTPIEALRAWAALQKTNPTERWVNQARKGGARRVDAARDFLEQHPDLSRKQLTKFLEWAHEQGVAEPEGWASWWPAWPSSAAAKALPHCDICDDRRLVPLDDEWTAMAPCVCTKVA